MRSLSHLNKDNEVRMVDITKKASTSRKAKARGFVTMKTATLDLIEKGRATKGNVLGTAKIAGIMAAKKTGDLIPLCHPLEITDIDLALDIDRKNSCVIIEAEVKIFGKTGVEMEALTAVSVAALTIYDMCKSVDKKMVIGEIMLVEKTGGKSGTFVRN